MKGFKTRSIRRCGATRIKRLGPQLLPNHQALATGKIQIAAFRHAHVTLSESKFRFTSEQESIASFSLEFTLTFRRISKQKLRLRLLLPSELVAYIALQVFM